MPGILKTSAIAAAILLALAGVLIAAFMAAGPVNGAPNAAPPPGVKSKVKLEEIVTGLDSPWGLAFLPKGEKLVTEASGQLRIISASGKLSAPVTGVPKVAHDGQGGLLDVAVAADFAATSFVYFSYSEPRGGRTNSTSVARAKLVRDAAGARLENLQVIFRQEPPKASPLHFGGRILFMPDGSLFITLGERALFPHEAQNPSNTLGKLVRIEPDGKPYPGNPKHEGWRPEIWSAGHRNMQAAAIHPQTGKVWTIEHGAKGGDEINIPQAGKNYGWPIISYGVDYSGAKIGEGTQKPGLEQPIYYWDPSIAPSSSAFYSGDKIPEWRGNLFVGALAGESVHRLVLQGEHVVAEEVLFKQNYFRVRNVRQGPDGYLWLVIDAPAPWGRVLRVVPAAAAKAP